LMSNKDQPIRLLISKKNGEKLGPAPVENTVPSSKYGDEGRRMYLDPNIRKDPDSVGGAI
jgi:hypothetical protein